MGGSSLTLLGVGTETERKVCSLTTHSRLSATMDRRATNAIAHAVTRASVSRSPSIRLSCLRVSPGMEMPLGGYALGLF